MSNSKKPAFPLLYDGEKAESFCNEGLTKREYIATNILQGLAANYLRETLTGWDSDTFVKEAIVLTDKLLIELDKEAN